MCVATTYELATQVFCLLVGCGKVASQALYGPYIHVSRLPCKPGDTHTPTHTHTRHRHTQHPRIHARRNESTNLSASRLA